ncbi:MAG: invasion associated locus B family protein [Rhodobacteraceae bacterium]|jgi:invasion protein IalB|nr:invasion associated locus B family protein [Paracoccaceae bacterium]
MTQKITALSLALALCLATAATAQDATGDAAPDGAAAETPAPATPAEGETGTVANDLSLGTVEGAEDGPGSQYVEATFGTAWEQRCIRTEDGSNPCQLYQLLKDAEGNSVAEISLFNLPEGGEAAAGATIVAPLETLLTENIRLKVDDSAAKIYPFTWCSPIGCVARVGFTADEVAQFKRGAKATLTIVPVVAPDQKVDLDLDLGGFTAGYDAIVAANAGDATPATQP